MTRPGSIVESHKRLMSWLIVAGSFVAYVGLVFAVGTTGVLVDLPLPWWVTQAVPPLLYGLMVLVVVHPHSAASLCGGALLLWAAHLLLGMLTEPVFALIGAPVAAGAMWTFPPSPLPQLLWVPVLLVPLRDPLREGSRRPQARPQPASDRRPVPERRTPAFSASTPPARPPVDRPGSNLVFAGKPLTDKPVASPTRGTGATPVTSMEARFDVGKRPMTLAAAPAASSPATSTQTTSGATEKAPSAGEPSLKERADTTMAHQQRLVDDLLAKETSEEPVRVSASRVLTQLPSDVLAVPAGRLAEELGPQAQLLIPRRLALSQLIEGIVRVRWEILAPQVPSHLLALTHEDITARLPEGQCVLPLDEIVRQFPTEFFLPVGPGPDVKGIEVFPAPFQPLTALDAGAPAASDDTPSDVTTAPLAEAEAEPEMSGAAMPVTTNGRATAPATVLPAELPRTVAAGTDGETLAGRDPRDGREDIVTAIAEVPAVSVDAGPEGEPHPVEPELAVRIWSIEDEDPVTSSAPEPSSPPDYSSRPDQPLLTELTSQSGASVPAEAKGLSSRLEEETLGWSAGHLVEAAPVAPASSDFRETWTPAPAVAAREDALDVARGLAALMPALVGPLAIDVRAVDGITLLTATSWALGDDVTTIPAALMLPLIYPGRAPWPVEQLTLRGSRAALILTLLGPLPAGGPVLAVSVRPGGALALLELRCRLVAAQRLARTGAAVDDGGAAQDERDEPDLLDVEPSTRTRELASGLGALGTVTASALRDADADRALYLFLPPGSDVRAVGALAHDVSSAMCQAAEAGVAFGTAVLRSGGRRIVIRLPAARSGPWGTIVAAGETAKPGLAYRQVEQAAAALGAL